MTERLYYAEPSRREFEARVARLVVHEGRTGVVLDRTAFYPTSGGQPFDTGRLGDTLVLETLDEGEDVVHVVGSPLDEGQVVAGEIDWPRRFDHMQQHTGQHVLSAAFDRLLDNRTVGFHMGADRSTIDLARETSSAEIDRVVDLANGVVWEDRAVSIRFVTVEEAARLPLRKEPTREGRLRLIEIDGFDLSACGGTHVDRTGAIGMIEVTGVERVRGASRVTFVCGGRVSRTFRALREAVAGSVRTLSVLPSELPAAVERLQAESRDLRKAVSRLQTSVAAHEATRLLATAKEVQGVRRLVCTLEGWDAGGLKAIAASLAAQPGVAAALFSTGVPVAAVIARSSGVGLDANAVLRRLLERFGGRGGGKADLAQGAGLDGAAGDLEAAARELISEC